MIDKSLHYTVTPHPRLGGQETTFCSLLAIYFHETLRPWTAHFFLGLSFSVCTIRYFFSSVQLLSPV